MTDRGQLDGHGAHLVPLVGTTILVVILVVNQVLKAMPDPGTVENVCLGICGCGACPRSIYGLLIIAALTVAASYVISVPKDWPDDD